EEVIRSRRQQAEREKTDKLLSDTPAPASTRPVRGIVVQGVYNCLIKFARCCTPVPGDKVVGFITKGYGISVHRAECQNCLNSRARGEDEGRWIDVSWGETGGELYTTTISLNARDRNGLIVDVATVLNAAKVKILSMNMAEVGGGKAVATIQVEVPDNTVLASVMSRLSLINNVVEVSRPGV
ncbi:MAG: bifunctional (p)ppGpp synthetase/guanosine-3',5'-bis(diphosphate) 3'-pyrophosphohydrolase, partial [Oscillospiraceae bacterium]|nr:bifunctional (p)ppGpp synthetase/guanosine-3',5'-bis(diphosphate) 3'-pyrophosphohydrolase [Oscillospiraceae bacterium]